MLVEGFHGGLVRGRCQGARAADPHCATLFTDQLPCPRHLSLESLAQTLALKIRALLAQEPDLRIGDATSETDAAVNDVLDLGGLRGRLACRRLAMSRAMIWLSRDAESAVLPSRPLAVPATPHPLGLASRSVWPTWSARRRTGRVCTKGAPCGSAWSCLGTIWPLKLDGVLTTAVVSEDTSHRTSLDEFPIGLALSRRWQRGRWVLSCGPRISVHFVHAEATSPDGRQGESWRTSVGLGASELLRYDGWGPIGLFASLTNEIVLPRRKFTVAGQEMAGSGFFQGAILAGVVYRFF
jgi:hypothetical protein